jgi:uncharacterized protein YkwD
MKFGAGVLARRLGGVVVMLLALGTAGNIAAPSAQAYTPSPASRLLYEYQVVNAINAQRANYHLGRLWLSPCPQSYADRWAPYMVWYFRHQSMFSILSGCHATVAAENLANGNASADPIVAAWMASPDHRANILDGRLTKIGVAAVYARGRWNVVADFTRS